MDLGAARRRPEADRSRYSKSGVRLAPWHALLPWPRERALGSKERPDRWQDCASHLFSGRRPHGAFAWVRQEDAKDSRTRFETRAQAHEGGELDGAQQKGKGRLVL